MRAGPTRNTLPGPQAAIIHHRGGMTHPRRHSDTSRPKHFNSAYPPRHDSVLAVAEPELSLVTSAPGPHTPILSDCGRVPQSGRGHGCWRSAQSLFTKMIGEPPQRTYIILVCGLHTLLTPTSHPLVYAVFVRSNPPACTAMQWALLSKNHFAVLVPKFQRLSESTARGRYRRTSQKLNAE